MEDDLVAGGRYVRIVTRGRHSGVSREVTIGFAETETGPAGSIVVAAGDTEADWALNLLDDPACRVRVGERTFDANAEPLDGPDHAQAIRALILRYGTSAEGLGHGPSFRLVPTAAFAADAEGPG